MTTSKHQVSPELLAKAQTIHKRCLVLDAHVDIVIPSTSPGMLGADGESLATPDRLRTGGVGVAVMCVAANWAPRTPEFDASGRAMADEKLGAVLEMIAANTDVLGLARSANEVAELQALGKTAVVLGFQNARALERDLGVLDMFFDAGVRVFALIHMGHNDYCDSSRPMFNKQTGEFEVEEEHGGLAALGRDAIVRINELGGIVDVSQMSETATLQTIELSTSPVVASHSNVRVLSDVTRNLSNEEIDRIGQTGGVVCVSGFGPSLVDASAPATRAAVVAIRRTYGLAESYSYPYELYWELADPQQQLAFQMEIMRVIGAGSVKDMVRHIDYLVDRIGIDCVGIGNDYNHGGGKIGGLLDASQSLNLTIALVKAGYSAPDIAKIWGENFLRVLQASTPAP